MNSQDYIKNALVTEPREYYKDESPISPRIDHAVMGLVTEAGDLMWYLAILADELGVSFEEIWDKNIRKLKKRFPEKYTNEKAINRDTEKERKELEK